MLQFGRASDLGFDLRFVPCCTRAEAGLPPYEKKPSTYARRPDDSQAHAIQEMTR